MDERTLKYYMEAWGDNYPVGVLEELQGFYSCPKNSLGEREGPLVTYTGTYSADGNQLQLVGDEYFDFAKVEMFPVIMHQIGKDLAKKFATQIPGIEHYGKKLVIAGPEKGGLAISGQIAFHLGCRTAYIEKSKDKLGDLIFGRHEINKGDLVIIGDDVNNNFSTAGKAIDLIHSKGGKVLALSSIVNRSNKNEYVHTNQTFPVISLVQIDAPRYRQDDTEVAQDILKGNIIWNPKTEWDLLPKAGKTNARKLLSLKSSPLRN